MTALSLNCEHMATTLTSRYRTAPSKTNLESSRGPFAPHTSVTWLSIVGDGVRQNDLILFDSVNRARFVGNANHSWATDLPLVALMDPSLLGYIISGELGVMTRDGLEPANRAYAYVLDGTNRLSDDELRQQGWTVVSSPLQFEPVDQDEVHPLRKTRIPVMAGDVFLSATLPGPPWQPTDRFLRCQGPGVGRHLTTTVPTKTEDSGPGVESRGHERLAGQGGSDRLVLLARSTCDRAR